MLPHLYVEPRHDETRLQLSIPGTGPVLRARLLPQPKHDSAFTALTSALDRWYGSPIRVVIDADAEELATSSARWAALLAPADPHRTSIHWLSLQNARSKDRFLRDLGDFRKARALASALYGGAP